MLDWDPQESKCLCRKHPCHNLNGVSHSCGDPRFPVLHYREEKEGDGVTKPVCECQARFEKATTAFRGAPDVQKCSWGDRPALPGARATVVI